MLRILNSLRKEKALAPRLALREINKMAYKRIQYHGYHGTSKINGERCIRDGTFPASTWKYEYFGYGTYFFEDSIDEARLWAHFERGYQYKDISIIYALIETDRVLDLFDTTTYREYMQVVKELIARFDVGEDVNVVDFDKPLDCKVINLICNQEGYLLVRGPYRLTSKLGDLLQDAGYTRIPRVHIQLCVRDCSIIKEYEVDLPKGS